MPASLDPGDRPLVIGAAVIMFLLLVMTYVLRPAPGQAIGDPSSYSTQWLGAKGAYLLLQELGYRVERWDSSAEALPDVGLGTTLIFAEPSEKGTPAERAAVARFVSSGGRLVVMGASGASFAPQAAAQAIPSSDLTPQVSTAIVPSPLSRDAREITLVAPDKWTSRQPSQLSVYGSADNPTVVWYRFGQGQVIWWAIASPLSNGSIRDKSNLAFFLNSVGPSTSRVLWDEYYHGVRRSLVSYFADTPLPWAGVQIAIGLAALLFTFSRRSGPTRMPATDSRLSPLEFVETLGDLYQSAKAAPAVVATAYHRLRLSLGRKLSLPSRMKLQDFCRIAETRLGWPPDQLLHTLSAAERAMRDIDLDDRQALALVRELHDYSHRLETSRTPPRESLGWK